MCSDAESETDKDQTESLRQGHHPPMWKVNRSMLTEVPPQHPQCKPKINETQAAIEHYSSQLQWRTERDKLLSCRCSAPCNPDEQLECKNDDDQSRNAHFQNMIRASGGVEYVLPST
jgi:hypothetical protein